MNFFSRRAFAVCGLVVAALVPPAQADEQLTFDGRLKRDPVFADAGPETLIYVVQETPVQLRLMRLNLADGVSQPVNPQQTHSEFEPACSADGRYLAFVQSRGNLSLALVIRDLTTGSEAAVEPAGGFSGICSPALSADGGRLLYSFADGGRQQIFSVTPQATDQRTLIDSAGTNNWPSFSPDGQQILFSSTRDGNYEIYLAEADGSGVRRLTDHPRQDIRPRFSPDGSQIAFTSNRDGNYEIYVMAADGGNVQRITDHAERDDYPTWRPDGGGLICVAERDGAHDLWRLEVR